MFFVFWGFFVCLFVFCSQAIGRENKGAERRLEEGHPVNAPQHAYTPIFSKRKTVMESGPQPIHPAVDCSSDRKFKKKKDNA